jgi:hypothetical protein
MVSKCANPACLARFRYLHEGRIFNIEMPGQAGDFCRPRIELYWLCFDCARSLKLVADNGSGAVIRSRYPQLPSGPPSCSPGFERAVLGNGCGPSPPMHTKVTAEKVC